MSLTYADLQDLLIQREERTQQWRDELYDKAVEFSVALEAKMSPPTDPIKLPSTTDVWPPFQLSVPVEVEETPSIRGQLVRPGFEKYISQGALRFSIVLSFENEGPLCSIVCSCMVRLHEGVSKFGFGDALDAVSNWYILDDAVIAFLERIEVAYQSDSYARSDKSPVGFVHLFAQH
ncbi:MAG: hypothetical protein AB8B87_02560 [Granulosicoccus sp.]